MHAYNLKKVERIEVLRRNEKKTSQKLKWKLLDENDKNLMRTGEMVTKTSSAWKILFLSYPTICMMIPNAI